MFAHELAFRPYASKGSHYKAIIVLETNPLGLPAGSGDVVEARMVLVDHGIEEIFATLDSTCIVDDLIDDLIEEIFATLTTAPSTHLSWIGLCGLATSRPSVFFFLG